MILTDDEVSTITGIGFEATGRAIEQATLNKLSEQEPVAWNQAGKPLYLHPAPSVPEGYQLVPIEPTKAMMWALYGHWVGQLTHLDYGYYKAMLAAARSE